MKKKWVGFFEIGDPSIDNHHQEVFHLVSMLDQAIRSTDEAKIRDIILFLEGYVQDHFYEEEALMKTHHYKGLKAHEEEHKRFKGLVKQLRIILESDPSKAHLVFKIRQFIDELIRHIKNVDVGLVYLLNKTEEKR